MWGERGYERLFGEGFCMSPDLSGWNNDGTARIWVLAKNKKHLKKMCDSDVYCVGFTWTGYNAHSIMYTTSKCKTDCEEKQWIHNPLMINHVEKTQTYGKGCECYRYNPIKCNSLIFSIYHPLRFQWK